MLLTADIGNSGITLGFFKEKKLIQTYKILLKTDEKELKNDIKTDFNISNCIISSVVRGYDIKIKKIIDQSFNINSNIITNSDINKIIPNITKEPDKTGVDRLINVYSAMKQYSSPAIVIDLGTATTFDILNSKSEFIGGIIMPGISTQLKSLHSETSLLPQIQPEKINKTIGVDTKSSILSGIIRGQACAISGLIQQCKKEMGENPKVILTGGYSDLISEYLDEYDILDRNLTLQGLRLLWEDIFQGN